MDWILIIGVFEAVFLAALLMGKKKKSVSDYWLIVLMLVFGFTILSAYLELYNYKHGFPFPVFMNLAPLILFLHGPLLWLYIKSLTDQYFHFKPEYLLHFIPFMLAFAGMYIDVYSLSLDQRIAEINSGEFREGIVYPSILAGIFLVNQLYFIWGLIMIKQYRQGLKNYFARIEAIDLNWLRFVLMSAIIAYAVNSALFILDYFFEWMTLNALMLITFITGSLFILALGFYGQRQTNVFQNFIPKIDLNDPAGEQKQGNNNELLNEDEQFIDKLLKYMEQEKPYIFPDINVNKLAKQMNVSPEYLSGIINRHLYRNFFDFINSYRVEAFKEKVRDPEYRNLTLLSIAYDCGFNSKATFNRVFRNSTGVTPSTYARG